MGGVEFLFDSIESCERLLVGAGGEWFCRVSIRVFSSEGAWVLVDFNWDAKEIFDWFERNRRYICTEERPAWCMEPTIAGSVEAVFESDEVDDACLDEIYNYRLRHDLRFAVRGAKIPSVYFGCGVAGGEVSAVIGGEVFCISVNFSDFYFRLGAQKKYISERVVRNYLEEQ